MPILPPSLSSAAERYSALRPDRWAPVPPGIDRAIAVDRDLADVASEAREALIRTVVTRLGPLDPRYLDAMRRVPRERFVLPEDIALSAFDAPLPLDVSGTATVSAPHAYLLTFRLLDLSEGDHLLELGTGTGYGAALARAIIGRRGHVTTVEVDPILAERAFRLLDVDAEGARGEAPPIDDTSGLTVIHGDARALAPGLMVARGTVPNKIAVTYALAQMPSAFQRALPEGAVLVAPVGGFEHDQQLVRYEKRRGSIHRTTHGAVRYVPERNY